MGLRELQLIKEQARLPKAKKVHTIAPVTEKKKMRDRQAEVETVDDKLSVWFPARRLEMKGVCAHCGGLSCKLDDPLFAFSIAHILPKAYFPSVATHPLNWIELCFWGESCHSNYDNKILLIGELNCFDLVVKRFQAFYPYIAQEERRRIPELLKNYINIDL